MYEPLKKRQTLKRSTTNLNSVTLSPQKKITLKDDENDEFIQKQKNDEFLLKEVIEILKKSYRSYTDYKLIAEYLKKMTDLIKMIRNSADKMLEDLLRTIAYSLKYEFYPKNQILFKLGEKGDKFYVILDGRVSILVAKSEKILLSEEEYYKYLLRLRRNEEYDILRKCIIQNRLIYPVDKDDFDTWLGGNTEYLRNKMYNVRNSVTFRKRSTAFPELEKEIKDTINLIHLRNEHNLHNQTQNVQITTTITEKFSTTVRDYIESNKPVISKVPSISNEKRLITIWVYHHINTLSKGDKFGDIALDSSNQKRTATIITEENCHFGIVDKVSYQSCLKEINEKSKRTNIGILYNNKIFKGYPKEVFERNYFNLFKYQSIERREKILEEGKVSNFIYFLKNGDYEVSMNRSLKDLEQIICSLGSSTALIDSNFYGNFNFFNICLGDEKFKKYISIKRLVKITIIKNHDIIGLGDCYMNKQGLFNIECVSNRGELFVLQKKIFDSIMKAESMVETNSFQFVQLKRGYLLDRLLNYRKTLLSFYERFEDNKPIITRTNYQNYENSKNVLIKPKQKEQTKSIPINSTVSRLTKQVTAYVYEESPIRTRRNTHLKIFLPMTQKLNNTITLNKSYYKTTLETENNLSNNTPRSVEKKKMALTKIPKISQNLKMFPKKLNLIDSMLYSEVLNDYLTPKAATSRQSINDRFVDCLAGDNFHKIYNEAKKNIELKSIKKQIWNTLYK